MRSVRWLGWKTAAILVLVLAGALALWLWRDPMALVRAEWTRQRWAAGLSLRQTQVAGHHWVYVERAAQDPAAPTVVMIHGFTGSKENWYPLAGYLADRYRVVIPDLPGWGASERRAGEDYGFDAQNQRVAQFIAQVAHRPGSPVVLLGHSMGGGIAALTAADRPDLVDRVGLLDAAGVRFAANRFGEQVLAGQNPFAVHDENTLKQYLDTVFYLDSAKPWIPWPASRALIQHRRQQAAFEQAVLDRIGRSEQAFLPEQAATHIQQPTLLLWCTEDRVIDPSALESYAQRIPQAIKVRLSGCGHMSLMERPGDVAAAVDYLIRKGVGR